LYCFICLTPLTQWWQRELIWRHRTLCTICSDGNNFFKNKQYPEAIAKYTEAINEDPSDVTFYSNRSACYAALCQWNEAAEDGRQCIITDKSFVKGYFRAALALQNLGNLEASLDAVKRGLGIDSQSADLKRMSRELDEALRVRRVEAAISAADNQLSLGDISSAYKTVDGALRLDPTNEILKKQMDKIRPQYEREEKFRSKYTYAFAHDWSSEFLLHCFHANVNIIWNWSLF
jgi:tetratricopeptide (TPR) repeat protein